MADKIRAGTYVRTLEHRKKMSGTIASTPCVLSAEGRQRIIDAQTWERTPEIREKIRKANTGKKHTAEARAKISSAMKGKKRKPFSPATLQKLSEHMKRNRNNGRIPTRTKFTNTSIERAIESMLSEQRIDFEKQVSIEGIAVVDFFIPSLKTIIEADGCYWHGCPEHALGKNPQKSARDIRVTGEMIARGYRVIRLWEHDIKVMQTLQDII